MTNIKLSNSLGGSLIACAAHLEDRRRFLVCGPFTETATEEPCPVCVQEQQTAALPGEVRAALLSPNLSHTRARRHCGASVCIYHRDDTSPSGVMLAAMCPETMFDEIFAELRAAGTVPAFASPLSPTEGRRS